MPPVSLDSKFLANFLRKFLKIMRDHVKQEKRLAMFIATQKYFSELEWQRVLQDFLAQFAEQGHPFFPMWLKQKNVDREIFETAYIESIQYSVQYEYASHHLRTGLQLNPQVKRVKVHQNLPFLNLAEGEYVFWFDQELKNKKLNSSEASVLDRFEEDVIYVEGEIEDQETLENLENLGILLRR
jgi:hypothetical protein